MWIAIIEILGVIAKVLIVFFVASAFFKACADMAYIREKLEQYDLQSNASSEDEEDRV